MPLGLTTSSASGGKRIVNATDFWADAPDDWVGAVPPWHEYVGPELTDELMRAAECDSPLDALEHWPRL